MDLELFLLATAVILIGATIQGLVGFGMNSIAAPLFFLLEPDLVPAPVILAALVHTILSAWRERSDINFSVVGWLITGTVPGVVTGALIAGVLSEAALGVLVSCVILCAAGLLVAGFILPQSKPASVGAGIAAGFSSAVAAVSGPMASLYLARLSGPELRSTLAAYFLVAGTVTLSTLALLGEFSSLQFAWGLLLMPAVVAGFALSSPLRRFVDGELLRKLVIALSATAAVTLLIRSLL